MTACSINSCAENRGSGRRARDVFPQRKYNCMDAGCKNAGESGPLSTHSTLFPTQSFASTVMEHVSSHVCLKPYQLHHGAASQPVVTIPPFHTGCTRSTRPHQQRPRELAVSAQAQPEGPPLPTQHHCPTSWNESRCSCLPDLCCWRTSVRCALPCCAALWHVLSTISVRR